MEQSDAVFTFFRGLWGVFVDGEFPCELVDKREPRLCPADHSTVIALALLGGVLDIQFAWNLEKQPNCEGCGERETSHNPMGHSD